MASRVDVIMSRFKRGTAQEELKEQERIENSKAIKALDTMTAMAEGAEIGWSIGQSAKDIKEGVGALKDGAQNAAERFRDRRQMKKTFIEQHGRKAWRSGTVNSDGTQMASGRALRRAALADKQLTKKDLISMYLEGTEDWQTNPDGSITRTSDKRKPVNVSDYQSVPGFVGPVPDGENKGFVGPTPEGTNQPTNKDDSGKDDSGSKSDSWYLGKFAGESLYEWWKK